MPFCAAETTEGRRLIGADRATWARLAAALTVAAFATFAPHVGWTSAGFSEQEQVTGALRTAPEFAPGAAPTDPAPTDPAPTADPTPSTDPTSSTDPTPTPDPTPSAEPSPSADPTPSASPTPTPEPTTDPAPPSVLVVPPSTGSTSTGSTSTRKHEH
jgi:outer membrane biosynthesis protein TonB